MKTSRQRFQLGARYLLVLAAAMVAMSALAACGGSGDGSTKEVGSAALMGFDSGNVTALAYRLDPSPDAAPLRVYVGRPGTDPFSLGAGRYLVQVINPVGDMDERLITVTAARQAIDIPIPSRANGTAARNDQRLAAAVVLDYALIHKLSLLEIEQMLTDDFKRPLGDAATKLSDQQFDDYLAITNGLSRYQIYLIPCIQKLIDNSRYRDSAIAVGAGPHLAAPIAGDDAGPSAGLGDVLPSIKDFFTKHGKSGNDKLAQQAFERNVQGLSPDQQQQLFQDIKSGTADNKNVQNAGGIKEQNAADFFKAVKDGKYTGIAQDIEKTARGNGDYSSALQQNGDTPNERGKKEGGDALKDGAKIVEETIKQVVPEAGQKVIGAGEKINQLLEKKPTATPKPASAPTDTPVPSKPTDTPVPAKPTDTPVPNKPTNTPVPNKPTDTPVPPKPTDTPVKPTDTPVPAATDTPVPNATDTPRPAVATDTPLPGVPTVATPPGATATARATDTPGPPPPTPIPPVPINEITGVKVLLIKLGGGDSPNTTSYEIDVRVATKVRTQPAAMVICSTTFGGGHDIGSSSLYPGETFTIPLHRQDIRPAQVVTVSCKIVDGNTLVGAATTPGKAASCPSTRNGATGGGRLAAPIADDGCDTATPQASETSAVSATATAGSATSTPSTSTTAVPTSGASTTAVPILTDTPQPAVSTDTPAPAISTDTPIPPPLPTLPPPTLPPPTVPPPTLPPPPPTATAVPVATPTFTPQVIDGLFWPGNVFGVETSVVLQVGRLYRICFSGTMHMEEGDRTPTQMPHVNGVALGGNCVSLEGDGAPASITCGSGTPKPDPGGFNISVTDLGPI